MIRLVIAGFSIKVQVRYYNQEKRCPNTWKPLYFLVGVRGFEPPASWSRTKRSTKLSHTPSINKDNYKTVLHKIQVQISQKTNCKALYMQILPCHVKKYESFVE